MRRSIALIAGASGHVGSQLASLLERDGNWQVLTLGRSAGNANHISADLLQDDLDLALSKAPRITHLFYSVRALHNESGEEDVVSNLLMLQRLVGAVERQSPSLSHIHIVEGGKWYGAHLGPYKTPAHEDDPRPVKHNFYHAQEDWLRGRQPGAQWVWTASRPSFVCAVTPGQGRNMVSTLGAYAAICRELNTPLEYPGSEKSFRSLTEITEGNLLAGAIHFLAAKQSAVNRAFNVTNGDYFTWADIWPSLAEFFGVDCGSPRAFSLREWAADKEGAWSSILARHGLKNTSLSEIASWSFADFFIGQDYDVASSTDRLREAGFQHEIESGKVFFSILSEYRRLRLLP